MEATMTAIIVAARTGITDRIKTCARASIKAKARTWRTMARDFASLRAG
jgi:hypothetical protein